jgi:hypothetical protein
VSLHCAANKVSRLKTVYLRAMVERLAPFKEFLITVFGLDPGYLNTNLLTSLFNAPCGLVKCSVNRQPMFFKKEIDLRELSKAVRLLSVFPGKEYIKILQVVLSKVQEYDILCEDYSSRSAPGDTLLNLHISSGSLLLDLVTCSAAAAVKLTPTPCFPGFYSCVEEEIKLFRAFGMANCSSVELQKSLDIFAQYPEV